LVKALEGFGSLSGGAQLLTPGGESGFAPVPTWDLTRASYSSPYLSVKQLEVADLQGNPLQQPDAQESQILNALDPGGGFPFLLVGGLYVVPLQYSPGLLAGRTFSQVQADAAAGIGPDGQAISAEADVITALICKTDGGRPAAVCTTPPISALVLGAP
jgi:hypothetical protein